MSLVGKAAPDVAAVVVTAPTTKTSIKKLSVKGKAMVILFVSKTMSPVETNAAVQKLEESSFQAKGKAVFVIVSLDSLKAAQELHKEGAIKNCTHIFASTQGKEYGVVRTPAHFVVGTDGKIKMASEEELAPYMTYIV